MRYFRKETIRYVCDRVFAGLVFLAVLFAIILLMLRLWEELK